MQQICRHIVFLSERLKYVSIVNYLSVVTQLHKLYGYDVSFNANYMVRFTLAGVRGTLGDPIPARPTLHISELMAVYRFVQLGDINERTMWACIVLGFRSLLRKSNMVVSNVEDCHVIR